MALIEERDDHYDPESPDRERRDAAWDALWEDDDWNELWGRHPGFEGYRQLSVRFLDEV